MPLLPEIVYFAYLVCPWERKEMEGVKENTTLERDDEYWFDLGRGLLSLRDVDDDESTLTEPFLS